MYVLLLLLLLSVSVRRIHAVKVSIGSKCPGAKKKIIVYY